MNCYGKGVTRFRDVSFIGLTAQRFLFESERREMAGRKAK